jgi:hypothetical protein
VTVSSGERTRGVGRGIRQSKLLPHDLHTAETEGEHEEHGRHECGELRGDASGVAVRPVPSTPRS